MSKERLEEIDKVVDDLLNNRGELTNFVNDYYLQAERVQELEKVRKTLSDNHFQQIEQHKYLVQQNKELREALVETSRIIENIKDIWRVKE